MQKPSEKSPKREKTEFEGIAQIIRQCTASQNDALAQVTNTLESMSSMHMRMQDDSQNKLLSAYAKIQELSEENGELRRRDLEREKAMAQSHAEIRKEELSSQKTELLLKTAAGMLKAYLANSGANALPGASTSANAETKDPLASALAEVLSKISEETMARLRAEAGDEDVMVIMTLVYQRLGVELPQEESKT